MCGVMSWTDDDFVCVVLLTHYSRKIYFLFRFPFPSRPGNVIRLKACEVSQNQYSHYKCDENGDLKCLPGMVFLIGI